MSNEGDRSENWTIFIESWTDYALINDIYRLSPRRQLAHFRSVLGDQNRVFLNQLGVNIVEGDKTCASREEPCASPKAIIDALTKQYKTPRNVLFQRYLFERTSQSPTESVKEFRERITRQVKKCEYKEHELTILRDKLIFGTRLTVAREALFREEDHTKLTVELVVRTLETYEDNEAAIQVIERDRRGPAQAGSQVENVAAVQLQGARGRTKETKGTGFRTCKNCGRTHGPRNCPAWGQTCNNCRRKNHFERMCDAKRKQKHSVKLAHESSDVENDDYEAEYSDDTFRTETVGRMPKRKLFVTLQIGNSQKLRALLDTGATCNVMGQQAYLNLRRHNKTLQLDRNDQAVLRMYNNSRVTTMGTVTVDARIGNVKRKVKFQVVENKQIQASN